MIKSQFINVCYRIVASSSPAPASSSFESQGRSLEIYPEAERLPLEINGCLSIFDSRHVLNVNENIKIKENQQLKDFLHYIEFNSFITS